MVSLRLKGPRRRESERVKTLSESISAAEFDQQEEAAITLSNSATAPLSTKASGKSHSIVPEENFPMTLTSANSSPGDTIKVKHRTANTRLSRGRKASSPGVGPLSLHERVMSPPVLGTPKATKTHASNDDVPRSKIDSAGDVEMHDADESVVEYDVNDDADRGDDDEEEEDDGQDTVWYKAVGKTTEDVITISSDDGKDDGSAQWDLTVRPWKDFNRKTRHDWEMMYCHVTDYAMKGDWSVTEEYQHEKDKEMLRYMEDFPLPEWVLPQHIVLDAYNRLIERIRWRSLGIRIYGRERIPEWMPGSTKQLPGLHAPSQYPSPSHHGSGDQYSYDATLASRHSAAMPPPRHHHHSRKGSASIYVPRGKPQPPSHQVLPSQPNAQPIVMHPNSAPNMPAALPSPVPNAPSHHTTPKYPLPIPRLPSAPQAVKRKGRAKKAESPPRDSPLLSPPIPPYEPREKPADRRPAYKTGRRNARRHAESDEFPWNRLHVDFISARANATWDDSIYDPRTFESMKATRERNEAVIERIDQAESERQRRSRTNKKDSKEEASSETEQGRTGGRRKSGKKGDPNSTDPYHSGHFEFTPSDQPKIAAFGNKTPDEIMAEVEEGRIAIEDCADLTICWNPGKKGMTQDLEQARFSIRDTLVTRQQVAMTPVLLKRAAECIVDFCPDMLWRSMLLRIASEAGYGNKHVRDRMCLNGNYCDKATITKRIGSALGQKQQQSSARKAEKAKTIADQEGESSAAGALLENAAAYVKGEDEYYNENVQDFGDYVCFFGHRASHRSSMHHNQVGMKRKAIVLARSNSAAGKGKGKAKEISTRGKVQQESVQSPEATVVSDEVETSAVEGEFSGSENDGDNDAVSVQSDTILDQLDDD